MRYEELSQNYLEIYEKPYLSEIQDEQIIQMYSENILDERNKTQRPREKDGDVFYHKFKEKDNSFTFDAVNSLKIDDNQILQITKADVHEFTYARTHARTHARTNTSIQTFFKNHVFRFLAPRETIITNQ